MPADRKRIPKPSRPIPKDPSGEPREMKRIGESISGEQPEIGQKDTGIGRREPPAAPPAGKRRPRAGAENEGARPRGNAPR